MQASLHAKIMYLGTMSLLLIVASFLNLCNRLHLTNLINMTCLKIQVYYPYAYLNHGTKPVTIYSCLTVS